MKLGLGTAQFGWHYGVNNHQGKTPLSEVKAILEYAHNRGINIIDSAFLYGDSEKIIGQHLPAKHKFNLIPKIPTLNSLPAGIKVRDAIVKSFSLSLQNLKQESVYGLLVYDAEDLLSEQGDHIYGALQKIKMEGSCAKLGVSVYSRETLDKVLDRYEIEIVQMPINVFDQRMLAGNYLQSLKSKNIEIHVRSVFLQGLLLMPVMQWPRYFDLIREHALQYQTFVAAKSLNLVSTALGFVAGIKEVDHIICGVNDLSQLQQLHNELTPLDTELFAEFSLSDVDYLDPRRWQL